MPDDDKIAGTPVADDFPAIAARLKEIERDHLRDIQPAAFFVEKTTTSNDQCYAC